MRSILTTVLFFTILFSGTSVRAQSMDNARMDSLFRANLTTVTGAPGRWELTVGETTMLCITDQSHNRMRIITPVRRVEEASADEFYNCMEANFHSALDVKYAIADGMIWVAFIHPLAQLQDGQLLDALAQVRSAAVTYGTTYTSTDLVFPKAGDAEEAAQGDKKTRKL